MQKRTTAYALLNLLTGFVGILLLLGQKSEEKSQWISGFSLRKILLIVVILLALIGIALAAYFQQKRTKADQNSNFFLSKRWGNPYLWSALLGLLFLNTIFLILNTLCNPQENLSILIGKILGFLIFVACFSLSTFLFFLLPTLLCMYRNSPRQKAFTRKRAWQFLIFEFLWTLILALLFAAPLDSLQHLDALNGNSFYFTFVWMMILLLGGLVFFTCSPNILFKGISSPFMAPLTWYVLFTGGVILILLLGHISYGANDDYFMMLTASGQIDGIPDPHLIYSNVLIGQTLTGLFRLWPEINWYTTYLLLTLFLSCLILLRAILSHFSKQGIPWVPLAIFFIFIPRLFFTVNFTSTAMMCAFAGLILLLDSAVKPGAKVQWGQLAGGILFLTLSGMIRFQALGLSLLLFLPLLIAILLKKKSLQLLLALLCAGGLSLAAVWVNQQAYLSSPEWNTYLQYNQERGAIHGTPKLKDDESHQAFWQELGWGESGYQLFKNWLFVDQDVFTLQSLQAINQEYRYSLNEPDTFLQSFQTLTSQNPFEILTLLGVLFSVFVSPRFASSRQRKWQIGTSLYAVLLLLGLSIFLRLPSYILIPALLILCLILFYEDQTGGTVSSAKQFTASQKKELLFFAFLLFCQSLLLARTDQINLAHQINRDYVLTEVKNALPQDRNSLVVVETGSFPLEWASPLQSQTLPFAIVPTGWMVYSPEYNHQLEKYGIDNLMDSLASNANLYLLGNNQELILHYLADVKEISAHEVDLLSLPLQFERSYSLVKLSQLVEDSPRP
jgi:hypothetical protein